MATPLDWPLPSLSLMVRLSALTMPAVTEPSRPSGLPMATTVSPTCSALLSPNLAGLRSLASFTFTTPMSVRASVPTTLAATVLPSEKLTFTDLPASASTWLLVTMYPSELSTMPEPSPVPVVIATTLDFTWAMTDASDERSSTWVAPVREPVEELVLSSAACTTSPPTTPPPQAISSATTPVASALPIPPRRGWPGCGAYCGPYWGWYPGPGG
jgi:hypothetical protein